MTSFDRQLFADVAEYAGRLETQNQEYEVAGIRNPRFEHIAKNEIAEKQAALLAELAEYTEALPYEELGRTYIEVERELEECEARLPNIDSESCVEKLGVRALANRIIDFWPRRRDIIEARTVDRIAEINAARRSALEERIEQLKVKVGEIALDYEAAATPWPIPRAAFIEFSEPQMNEHTAPESRQKGVEHCIDQPNASQLIVNLLIERAGEMVTPQEIADAVYRNGQVEIRGKTSPEHRIVTILGPQVQGRRIQRMLNTRGHTLQYGWIESVNGSRNGKAAKRRVYRALPVEIAESDSSE